jgi:Flp pilus assembly pilin Flp
MKRIMPSLRALERDERGASLVEFGFAVPFLALLVTGVIDVSTGLSERFMLQQAVNRGFELLQAQPPSADAEASEIDYGFVRTEAAAAAGVPVVQVTLNKWLECDGVKQSNFDGTCPEDQEIARYLELRISKTFDGQFFLDNYPMEARGAVRVQ